MISIWSLWVCHHILILSTPLNFLHSYLRWNHLLNYTLGSVWRAKGWGRLKSLNPVNLIVFPQTHKRICVWTEWPINCSFGEGVVPSQWKSAIVVPVPKQFPPKVDKMRLIYLLPNGLFKTSKITLMSTSLGMFRAYPPANILWALYIIFTRVLTKATTLVL